MKIQKRPVDLVVISDIHLGTYGCHARELLQYLKSIKPRTLVLNGDIIDIWQFNKRYWPREHMQVIKHITGLIGKGVQVYYITGNHDEMLRKFVGFGMGSFKIVNKVVLNLDGKSAWFFHGDVFDITMQHSVRLARLGARGYDMLILLNRLVNYVSRSIGKGRISLSKKIKDGVKSALKYIDDFEQTAAEIGIENAYQYVVCGHIHQPSIREVSNTKGSVTYLNSGDWVENLTALEYHEGGWKIYRYMEDEVARSWVLYQNNKAWRSRNELFEDLIQEFKIYTKV